MKPITIGTLLIVGSLLTSCSFSKKNGAEVSESESAEKAVTLDAEEKSSEDLFGESNDSTTKANDNSSEAVVSESNQQPVVSPETASAKEISPPESEGNSAVGERSPSPLVGQGILEESREKGSEEVTKSQQEVPVKEVPVREVAAVEVNAKDDNVSANEEVANNNSGSEKIYVVQKDETLMWVAYKLYGDYRKWRELVALNRDVLGNSSELSEGLKLKYNVTSGAVVTNARGEPYLINWGDTLAKISQKVYETTKRWKDIWKNNKSMIKNPNIIFAGFTLYYIPKSELMAKY